MATLRKSKYKCGYYLVNFEANGERYVRSTRTTDLKTAKIILKDIEVKIAKGIFKIEDITPKKRVRYTDFVEQYLEYSDGRNTRKSYLRDRLTLKNFGKYAGVQLVESVDSRVIDQYINQRIGQVAKATVNLELRHLKAAFTLAVKWCYVDENPFKGVKPLVLPQRAPSFFTEEQLQSILERIEEHWLREVVLFAARTGIRIGELINIEWDDIDFGRRVIRIHFRDSKGWHPGPGSGFTDTRL